MEKWQLERLEDEKAKEEILKIHEEHPERMHEILCVFLRETSWGRKMDAKVTEAHEYLEKIADLLDDARESGAEKETDMYEYLYNLVYADFCTKHTSMQEAFCIWAYDVLEQNFFDYFGLKDNFSKPDSE